MNFDFENKVCLVTGAASGIGAAIALEAAANGARTIVADVDADGAKSVADQINDAGGIAQPFAVDVTDVMQVEAMVAFAEQEYGRLDMAVNNAGIGGPSAAISDYPLDGWHQVMNVNLNGVFYCLKYEIAAMQRLGIGGAIVNMASILGTVGFANAAAYTSAKHALIGLTKVAALEYAAKNIRVNAVGPAFIDTPLLSANLSADVLAQLATLHPAGRIGTPEEVSALTCFLLSDRASFISGSYHLVDGGYVSQ